MSRLAPLPTPVERGPRPSPSLPGAQRENSRHLAPVTAGREGSDRETPASFFLDALSAFTPFAHFPFARKAGGGGGAGPQPARLFSVFLADSSLLTPFSLYPPPPHSSPQLPLLTEATEEAGGRSWLQDIVSRERECFPFQLFLKQR